MSAPKLRITLADGATIDVQPTLEDRLRFETTLRKNKGWGALSDNALKLEPFLAWSAAERTGVTTLSWAEFTSGDTAALHVEDIRKLEAADDSDGDDAALEVEGVGKGTRKARSTSSPSPSA